MPQNQLLAHGVPQELLDRAVSAGIDLQSLLQTILAWLPKVEQAVQIVIDLLSHLPAKA